MAAVAVSTTLKIAPPLSDGVQICPLSPDGTVNHQGRIAPDPTINFQGRQFMNKCTDCKRSFRIQEPLHEILKKIPKTLNWLQYEYSISDQPMDFSFEEKNFEFLCQIISATTSNELIFTVNLYTDKDYPSQYICVLNRVSGNTMDFLNVLKFEKIYSEV
jgi:hypothetical protein